MDRRPNSDERAASNRDEDPIEEHLLNRREESQESIVSAAQEAFEQDQRDADHPSRKERGRGVEDPSHSRGSPRRRS